jgi:hypothetical protein
MKKKPAEPPVAELGRNDAHKAHKKHDIHLRTAAASVFVLLYQ